MRLRISGLRTAAPLAFDVLADTAWPPVGVAMLPDPRFAVRSLLETPGFTLLAIWVARRNAARRSLRVHPPRRVEAAALPRGLIQEAPPRYDIGYKRLPDWPRCTES